MTPIEKARAKLAEIPRCTAQSRQTGEQCQLAGTGAGGKCRFHGGASTGRPPIHGKNTKKSKLERDWLRLLFGMVLVFHGGKTKFFKPGRLSSSRLEEILNAKIPVRTIQKKMTVTVNVNVNVNACQCQCLRFLFSHNGPI